MGIHQGFFAVQCPLDSIRAKLVHYWPLTEITGEATLTSIAALGDWMQRHRQIVPATHRGPDNPGVETLGLWQDGDWAVVFDPSYTYAADKVALTKISADHGRCVSFIIETTGSYASFRLFEHGRLVRSLESSEGDFSSSGTPLPEEAGLPTDRFYVEEATTLQERFHIAPPAQVQTDRCLGLSVEDRTDYLSIYLANEAKKRTPSKPWWKFW